MMKLSDTAPCRKICDICRSLCSYQLRKKYDMSLWIYSDENTDTAECSHRFTGDERHHIWKIAVFLGGIVLFCSLLRAFCRLLKAC